MKYINKEDIIENKTKVSGNVVHLDKYDMYYVNFEMKDGTNKNVRVFSERGTIPNLNSVQFKEYQKRYPKELAMFFAGRLLGPQGLMAEAGRDDYIYLGGEFLKNGYIANRNMIQSNGKTGKENFEDNLFNIRMQVEGKDNQKKEPINENKGKHYVMGDIHGMYGSYLDAIKGLSTEDHLYIIGDVIDGGDGGIQILRNIMLRMKNPNTNPKITFLLGNHEMQFINTISIMNRHGLNKNDLVNIINRENVKSHIGSLKLDKRPKGEIELYQRRLKTYEKYYEELIKNKGLSEYELRYIETWMISNRGTTTIFDYLNCNPSEKSEIYGFLYDSYVALPQKIENKDYLFVHAMPPEDEDMIINMKVTGKGYKISDLTNQQYEFMLETGEYEESTYENSKAYGFTTICGHDAKLGNIIRNRRKSYVRIDAGCGHKQRRSKLALYCIEDDNVKYIDERENKQDIHK